MLGRRSIYQQLPTAECFDYLGIFFLLREVDQDKSPFLGQVLNPIAGNVFFGGGGGLRVGWRPLGLLVNGVIQVTPLLTESSGFFGTSPSEGSRIAFLSCLIRSHGTFIQNLFPSEVVKPAFAGTKNPWSLWIAPCDESN